MTEGQRQSRPAGLSPGSSFAPELEGLRGVAILLVFFFHIRQAFGEQLPPGEAWLASPLSPLTAFVYAGHTGVTLFFVLSAYLLCRPYFRAHATGRRLSARRFYTRRALRILPAYYVAVAFATVRHADTAADLARGIPYLFFLDAFGLAEPLIPLSSVWWSLTTEVQFYLLLPGLFALATHRVGRVLLLCGLLLWLVGYPLAMGTLGFDLESRMRISLSLIGRGSAFLMGALVAWLHESHGARLARLARTKTLLRSPGLDGLILLVLALLGLLLRGVAHQGFFEWELALPYWHLPESIAWGAVLLLVTIGPSRLGGLLCGRFIGWVGVVSYSLYLIHISPVYMAARWLSEPHAYFLVFGAPAYFFMLTVGIFGACLALSSITYRLIERPMLMLKQKVG